MIVDSAFMLPIVPYMELSFCINELFNLISSPVAISYSVEYLLNSLFAFIISCAIKVEYSILPIIVDVNSVYLALVT